MILIGYIVTVSCIGGGNWSARRKQRPAASQFNLTVFRLLTDFVCLYNYEFGLSLCKIVRSSVILLLPLYNVVSSTPHQGAGYELATLAAIEIESISSRKSNLRYDHDRDGPTNIGDI